MRIHRPLLEALQNAWHATFIEGHHAEKVLERLFKTHRKFGSRDRRFVAEYFYSGVRWWRPLVEEVKGSWSDENVELTDRDLKQIAERLLAIPLDHVAEAFAQGPRARAQSIPDWLDEWGMKELGDQWEPLLKRLNQPAPVYLRVNEIKTNIESLRAHLAEEGIDTLPVSGVPTALRLAERKNVFQTQAYKAGLFEMQDAGSQLIAPFTQAAAKMRVMDACAGAGGKTLHLGSLMGNSGRIIALDIHEWKLKELRLRASRAGLDNIETRVIASTKDIKRLEGQGDVVLLDVPCSGLGVLRRHPDTKWKLTAAKLQELAETQQDILKRYTLMAKPGGRIIYATCSILPSENGYRVKSFLENHSEFRWEGEMTVSPIETDFDGFYAARFVRV